jgi:hypothetical protein
LQKIVPHEEEQEGKIMKRSVLHSLNEKQMGNPSYILNTKAIHFEFLLIL